MNKCAIFKEILDCSESGGIGMTYFFTRTGLARVRDPPTPDTFDCNNFLKYGDIKTYLK